MSEITSQITSTNSHMENSAKANREFQLIQVSYHFNGKNYLNLPQLIRTILKRKEEIGQRMAPDQN